MKRDFNKLLRFADHLQSVKLIDKYEGVGTLNFGKGTAMIFYKDLYYMILPWFELELPNIFPQFSLNRKGVIQYHPNPHVSAPFILPFFFGLSTVEYMHNFVVGGYDAQYGPAALSYKSSPSECSSIIHRFVEIVSMQEDAEAVTQERTVIIEKYNGLKFKKILDAPPKNFSEL